MIHVGVVIKSMMAPILLEGTVSVSATKNGPQWAEPTLIPACSQKQRGTNQCKTWMKPSMKPRQKHGSGEDSSVSTATGVSQWAHSFTSASILFLFFHFHFHFISFSEYFRSLHHDFQPQRLPYIGMPLDPSRQPLLPPRGARLPPVHWEGPLGN